MQCIHCPLRRGVCSPLQRPCKQKARRHTHTSTQAGQTGLEMLRDKRFRVYQQYALVSIGKEKKHVYF